jgi:hypothetical protein
MNNAANLLKLQTDNITLGVQPIPVTFEQLASITSVTTITGCAHFGHVCTVMEGQCRKFTCSN